MIQDDESGLNELFVRYRSALPDPEASPEFMPNIWQRIEARRAFLPAFQRLARTAMAAFAVLALMLLALNMMRVSQQSPVPSYADALVADHSAEKTYYAESVVVRPPHIDDGAPDMDQ